MNRTLQDFARTALKKNLAKCSEKQKEVFNRMYSHKDITKPVNEVVDLMPADKLDWAMQQVENSLNG